MNSDPATLIYHNNHPHSGRVSQLLTTVWNHTTYQNAQCLAMIEVESSSTTMTLAQISDVTHCRTVL